VQVIQKWDIDIDQLGIFDSFSQPAKVEEDKKLSEQKKKSDKRRKKNKKKISKK